MTEIEIKNIIPVTNQHLFRIDVYESVVILEIYPTSENFFHSNDTYHVFTKNGFEEGIKLSWKKNYHNLPKNITIDCYRLL